MSYSKVIALMASTNDGEALAAVRGLQRKAGGKRGLRDRLVERPRRPARARPAHRVAQPGSVARRALQIRRERRGLIGVEHLDMPMTPARIWNAVRAARKGGRN